MKTDSERRLGYRLRYPADLSPRLKLRSDQRQVLDISEWGIRFSRPDDDKIACGQHFLATVQFHTGPDRTIAGRIVRVTARDIAALLDQGLDFHVIAFEHDFVLSRSP